MWSNQLISKESLLSCTKNITLLVQEKWLQKKRHNWTKMEASDCIIQLDNHSIKKARTIQVTCSRASFIMNAMVLMIELVWMILGEALVKITSSVPIMHNGRFARQRKIWYTVGSGCLKTSATSMTSIPKNRFHHIREMVFLGICMETN